MVRVRHNADTEKRWALLLERACDDSAPLWKETSLERNQPWIFPKWGKQDYCLSLFKVKVSAWPTKNCLYCVFFFKEETTKILKMETANDMHCWNIMNEATHWSFPFTVSQPKWQCCVPHHLFPWILFVEGEPVLIHCQVLWASTKPKCLMMDLSGRASGSKPSSCYACFRIDPIPSHLLRVLLCSPWHLQLPHSLQIIPLVWDSSSQKGAAALMFSLTVSMEIIEIFGSSLAVPTLLLCRRKSLHGLVGEKEAISM